MLESVFLVNFKPFSVSDSLVERISGLFCRKCGPYFPELLHA